MVSRRTVWQLVVDLLVDSFVGSLGNMSSLMQYMFHLIDLNHHVFRPFLFVHVRILCAPNSFDSFDAYLPLCLFCFVASSFLQAFNPLPSVIVTKTNKQFSNLLSDRTKPNNEIP